MPTPKKDTKKALEAARRLVIDEYGQIDAELAPVKPRVRRLEELAKQIRGWHATTEAGTTVIEAGNHFLIVVGPKAETTLFAEAQALYEALGHERFLQIAKVTLGGLEEHLSASEVAKLTRKERIGSRSLKAVAPSGAPAV